LKETEAVYKDTLLI